MRISITLIRIRNWLHRVRAPFNIPLRRWSEYSNRLEADVMNVKMASRVACTV